MSTNEPTGPHPVSTETRSEGSLNINTRTLVMAAVLLLGGTVGGGGITLASKAAPETAPEVTVALADMNQKLAAITITLAEMKTQLNGTGRENDKRDAASLDHEQRLRKIEQDRPR